MKKKEEKAAGKGSGSLTYRDAGVDISAGDEAALRIKKLVAETFTSNVLGGIGHFGAIFAFPAGGFQEPVLVSSVDGVGTKLKVAVLMDRHDTIGEDLVNHCVNDILTAGAQPLYFLDYLALGKVRPDIVEQIVSGMVRGCKQANCALIGGETAEMPDLYSPGEYDLAGTIVGVVERKNLLDGSRIREGDLLVALPSTGLHTNGYTLARKILFELHGFHTEDRLPGLQNSVGEELLKVHKNYFPAVFPLLQKVEVHGLAHITGGGLMGNLRRIVPPGLQPQIDWAAWERPRIFELLQELGNVPEDDMRRTFNLGVGFVIIVPEPEFTRTRRWLEDQGEHPFVIGQIVKM